MYTQRSFERQAYRPDCTRTSQWWWWWQYYWCCAGLSFNGSASASGRRAQDGERNEAEHRDNATQENSRNTGTLVSGVLLAYMSRISLLSIIGW